ncbi:hypothetical protein J1N35_005165 [Gossypium stocksii]|uniref:Uncharacterized protein n=1 Tax=Gossypium stocksii TaxID=47602 RepID=A0A9D3WEQ4_9ROSI|nr:hypothetical protein J1N35_005165 [Gossypium stocksii]
MAVDVVLSNPSSCSLQMFYTGVLGKWIKYSISLVADKGLKKPLYTSARLKKGKVLYLETHLCRVTKLRARCSTSTYSFLLALPLPLLGKTNYTRLQSKNNLQKAHNDWLLPLQMLVGGIAAANKNDIDQHAVDTVELPLFHRKELEALKGVEDCSMLISENEEIPIKTQTNCERSKKLKKAMLDHSM